MLRFLTRNPFTYLHTRSNFAKTEITDRKNTVKVGLMKHETIVWKQHI